jgi:YfiR/HmsC-like
MRHIHAPRGAPRRLVWLGLGLLIAMLTWTSSARAQTVTTAVALKAAFLFNFAKFAEWPPDTLARGQRLALCVVGDSGVADALERTIQGRTVESHELAVQVIKPEGPIRTCHLLYASGLDSRQITQLLDALKDTAVFTVSDANAFAAMGGVAQLILEKDTMRFAINVAAAKRARLNLSSKLLGLAQIAKDGHDAPR